MIETNSNTQYFASKDPGSLTRECLQRVDDYYKYISMNNRLMLWRRSYNYYNAAVFKDARLNRTGEQGEFTEMTVNHYRNLLIHVQNLICGQKPAFEVRSTNSDFKSQAQTKIANGILDYYTGYKGLAETTKNCVEDSLQFGDGYIYQGWDFSLGDPYMADQSGKIIKSGDVIHKNFSPVDVIFDFVGSLFDSDRQWYIIRDYQNKWDLIERYPTLREKILALSDTNDYYKNSYVRNLMNYKTENIPIYIFLHDRTEALPDGRFFSFGGDDCWFVDSALPPFYKKLPIYRLCGSKQRNSSFGYSIAFDMLPVQEAFNGLCSTIITNQSTFGVQNILMPAGSNIGLTELSDGLNLLTYDPKLGKPESLNLVSTAPEIFKFLEMLGSFLETLSGINSVARGNPDSSLKSGTALALIQSMAIQFISGLQQNYAKLIEDLGTGLLNILKANAKTPRMIEIAGKNNKSYMKEFIGDDLSSIDRATVNFGNPLSRTAAGKTAIAENLLQAGLITNPQQYLQVLSTGQLDPLIEGQEAELMLIRSENEAMSEGKQVQVMVTDNPSLHIPEHQMVMSSVDARMDGNVVIAFTNHIQQHLELWRTADPAMLMLLKIPPPPAPMMPIQQPNIPQVQNKPIHPGDNHSQLIEQHPAQIAANKVHPANMPKNPVTGQPANLNVV